MVENKIPFTSYDYFSIIICGSIILTSLILLIPTEFLVYYGGILNSFGELKYALIFLIGFLIIIFSYLIGLIISGISSYLIETHVINKRLKYPSSNLFNSKSLENKKYFHRYRKPYSKEFQAQFQSKFDTFFKGTKFSEDEDKFKLCFMIVKEKSPSSHARLNNFLRLYGLFRNLTITMILISPIFILNIILSLVSRNNIMISIDVIILILIPPLCLFFFNDFLKFFRNYADEVFRAFYIISLEQKEAK